MNVIYSKLCVKQDIEIIKRTWRERLFTRPFSPRMKTRFITKEVPNYLLITVSGVEPYIVAHPSLQGSIEALMPKLQKDLRL